MTINEAFDALLLGYAIINTDTGETYWLVASESQIKMIKSIIDRDRYSVEEFMNMNKAHAAHRISTICDHTPDIEMFQGTQWSIGHSVRQIKI